MEPEQTNEYVNKQLAFNDTMTKAILRMEKTTRTQHQINQANIEVLREQDSRINTHRQLIIVNTIIAAAAIIIALVI